MTPPAPDPRGSGPTGEAATAPDREPSLEEALARLEQINQRLESGDLELAEALGLYEEGVRLIRLADGVLGRAEQRIHRLRPDGDGGRLDPLGEEEP